MITNVPRHFGIPPAALLGNGSESYVYALDHARVVRVYPPSTSHAYVRARQNFYLQLATQQPAFTIPQVLEFGVVDAHPYIIEQRMYGNDFAHVLPRLQGRERALQTYPEPVSTKSIDLYRLYYSLYFSDCRPGDPKTYAWCMQNLRAYTHQLP